MKNLKKIILVILIVGAIIGIGLVSYNKLAVTEDVSISENAQPIATMYYSNMIAIDAGTDYSISLYATSDNTYKYEVTTSTITIRGPEKVKTCEKGTIKSKSDLINLDNKYKANKESGMGEMYSSYRHSDNFKETIDIETLANKLFK